MQPARRTPYLLAAVLVLAACVPQDKTPSGAEDYAAFCAGCHGADGKGGGEAALGLAKKPADLTALSRAESGTFPAARVMAKVWGYTGRTEADREMPKFAALLDGELVGYDSGDGILTPTPVRLVQLAEYVKALQD